MALNREELALEMIEAEWNSLRAHLERGGLIVVAAELDLIDVALKVAGDDAAAIGSWISAGQLAKPSAPQINQWDADKLKCFRMLIVSPYVLIQE